MNRAWVDVENETIGRIERGLLVYLGVGKGDSKETAAWMSAKLEGLRIFEDDKGKMNRSVSEVGAAVLVICQFTLYGDVRTGRRPGFDGAAPPAEAEALYESVCALLATQGLPVQKGRFRADMQVHSQVDGPVTILIDSERLF